MGTKFPHISVYTYTYLTLELNSKVESLNGKKRSCATFLKKSPFNEQFRRADNCVPFWSLFFNYESMRTPRYTIEWIHCWNCNSFNFPQCKLPLQFRLRFNHGHNVIVNINGIIYRRHCSKIYWLKKNVLQLRAIDMQHLVSVLFQTSILSEHK